MSVFSNSFSNNNITDQLIKSLTYDDKPCSQVPSFIVSYFYESPTGWNAVLVGFLACILTIIFLLTCLYYLICRYRYSRELSNNLSSNEQNGTTSMPITNLSQAATTTFINEPGKEIKIMTYTEQISTITGDSVGNRHSNSPNRNALLTNGNTDPSGLRLLQHEHH
ncbi:unnamed protein product [Rotaria sordida]|uniref:Uncharacterized protein n=1 Tax=Rotaria sordida TaxID=392033 RepID=A0A818KDX0_9BILA|nr:unnamed protein product [Rotaria sordida]CAF1343075.1 unnamed protein product [Rotaria sordida]CAF3556561.1 unnamed protein product [Rotaria sordida]CAF3558515.1 unnamed protein product [Rotaria sordida]